MCQILLCRGCLETLKSFTANRIFGEAYDILLITVIYLIIRGANIALTPNPQSIINDIQGIPDPACKLINALAVAVNTGAPHAQINGILNVFGGL